VCVCVYINEPRLLHYGVYYSRDMKYEPTRLGRRARGENAKISSVSATCDGLLGSHLSAVSLPRRYLLVGGRCPRGETRRRVETRAPVRLGTIKIRRAAAHIVIEFSLDARVSNSIFRYRR